MDDIVLVWENLGPGHIDRSRALAAALKGTARVLTIEIFERSETYSWDRTVAPDVECITIFKNRDASSTSSALRYVALVRACLKRRRAAYFLCHYERPSTLLLAATLRLLGKKIFVMNDSKFDDYPRHLFRELLKYCFYMPYHGAVSSGVRSKDYLRFLGVPSNMIVGNYNAIDLKRIKSSGGCVDVAESSFVSKHFTVVARLVPKKNLYVTLDAFAQFSSTDDYHRKLVILGSGPLEQKLRLHATKLGIDHLVEWRGFVQADIVARTLASTLALILLSTEEQFGNVIIEAQALLIPCIVSTQVGARDELIRSAVTGFVVEPDNSAGSAHFMSLLSSDYELWLQMRLNVQAVNRLGDAPQFAEAVLDLCRRSARSGTAF